MIGHWFFIFLLSLFVFLRTGLTSSYPPPAAVLPYNAEDILTPASSQPFFYPSGRLVGRDFSLPFSLSSIWKKKLDLLPPETLHQLEMLEKIEEIKEMNAPVSEKIREQQQKPKPKSRKTSTPLSSKSPTPSPPPPPSVGRNTLNSTGGRKDSPGTPAGSGQQATSSQVSATCKRLIVNLATETLLI